VSQTEKIVHVVFAWMTPIIRATLGVQKESRPDFGEVDSGFFRLIRGVNSEGMMGVSG
jgi:hypothetical protein